MDQNLFRWSRIFASEILDRRDGANQPVGPIGDGSWSEGAESAVFRHRRAAEEPNYDVNAVRDFWIGVMSGAAGGVPPTILSHVLSQSSCEPQPRDPATLMAVGVLFVGVAMLACRVPARRAARVDPLEA